MAETSFDAVSGSLNNFISLDNNMTFVPTSTQTVAKDSSYTAPEDGFYSIMVGAEDGENTSGIWYLDAERTTRFASGVSLTNFLIPLKGGTTIYTRKNYGQYKVYGYFKHT